MIMCQSFGCRISGRVIAHEIPLPKSDTEILKFIGRVKTTINNTIFWNVSFAGLYTNGVVTIKKKHRTKIEKSNKKWIHAISLR